MSKSWKFSIYPQLPHKSVSLSISRAFLTESFFAVAARATAFSALLIAASPAMRAQTPSVERPIVYDGSDVQPDLSAYISPDLDRGEQAIVRATLENMPQRVQEELALKPSDSVHIAIVEGGTGIIHYNRPEDEGTYEVKPDTEMPGDANPFAGDAGVDPGVYGGSGPYRRVYTKPMAALAQPTPSAGGDITHQHFYITQGDTSIVCNAGSFATGDIGYSYMGGWSGTWNTLTGKEGEGRAIDAGLQYSPANNNYAMIMAIAGGGIITKGNYKGAATPPRIQCTNKLDWADVRFYAYGAYQIPSVAPSCWNITPHGHIQNFIGFPVKDCNTYALVLEVSSDQFVGHVGSIESWLVVWFSPNYQYGGWGTLEPYTAAHYNGSKNVPGWVPRVPCENCAFKWMTSIAQKKENLTDKSWYAAAWGTHRIVDWGASRTFSNVPSADLYCTEYPLWHTAYPSNHAEDCLNTPKGLTGIQQSVSVSDYSSERETDLIDLKY